MAKGICTVEGCESYRVARGYCGGHYQRSVKYGDPLVGGPLAPRSPRSVSAEERFSSKVDRSGDCWLWTGYLKPNGYASFYPGGGRSVQKVYAHRFAYEMASGTAIPEGMEIDHTCSVRHCVNPAHLALVTRSQNIERRNAANGWTPLSERTPRPPKTHCLRGHEFNDENTYVWRGYRYCKTCRLESNRGRKTPNV